MKTSLMYYKSIILLFFILTVVSCSKPIQKQSNDPCTLTVSMGKYVEGVNDTSLLVNAVLSNNTSKTLRYIVWTCPVNREYNIKSKALTPYRFPIICNATFPEELDIAPYKTKETEVKLFFKKNFHGGAVQYQILFSLYDDPKKYFKALMINNEELAPKIVSSNIVDMYIDPSVFGY